jgi:hypothetical protein
MKDGLIEHIPVYLCVHVHVTVAIKLHGFVYTCGKYKGCHRGLCA